MTPLTKKLMSSNPECAYFWSKRKISKTLDLGHTVNSGSVGGCNDVKTCQMNIFHGEMLSAD
jgi:hypothetical protein